MLALLLVLLLELPPDRPRPAPPKTSQSVAAFRSLGCSCAGAPPNAFRCDQLPAFGDNEWIHQNERAFALRAKSLALAATEASNDLSVEHHLALEGWADKRLIMHKKRWSEASPECRGLHKLDEFVSNLDLAYLRACELRLAMPIPMRSEVRLMPAVDFGDVKNRKNSNENYEGDAYKAVVLFIVFPRTPIVCPEGSGNEKR